MLSVAHAYLVGVPFGVPLGVVWLLPAPREGDEWAEELDCERFNLAGLCSRDSY